MLFRRAILVLVCLLASAALPIHAADPQMCHDADVDCFERNQVAACHEPLESTIETCRAWIRVLERQATNGPSNAELRLADAYVSLAANLVTDPAAMVEYEKRARSIYQKRIRRNSNDTQALISLAGLVDEEAERINLLKRGVTLNPKDVSATRWLASLLHERNSPGDALAAANYMDPTVDD